MYMYLYVHIWQLFNFLVVQICFFFNCFLFCFTCMIEVLSHVNFTEKMWKLYTLCHSLVFAPYLIKMLCMYVWLKLSSMLHPPLLAKLKTFGICGPLLDWFKSYITNRMQRVTLDGQSSNWLPVTSGVPQGSILGPLLFILYINDLPSVLSPDTICAIFADDTKIGREIKTINDQDILQTDIDGLCAWGDKWGQKFNRKKCKTLKVHRSPNPKDRTYKIGDEPLETVANMPDLGVTVDQGLKWKKHIKLMCKQAAKKLWLVIRTLSFHAPVKAKLASYQALIRSTIEYAPPVWSPRLKTQLKEIEAIQSQSTNYNTRYDSPHYLDYKTRLIRLKLLPTSYRCEILDITLLLKSIHDKTNLDLTRYIHLPNRLIGPRTRLQDNSTRMTISKTKLDSTTHFYTYRICKIWTSLPQILRQSLINIHEPLVIKQHLLPYYRNKLVNVFDTENQCTWTSCCGCGRC